MIIYVEYVLYKGHYGLCYAVIIPLLLIDSVIDKLINNCLVILIITNQFNLKIEQILFLISNIMKCFSLNYNFWRLFSNSLQVF